MSVELGPVSALGGTRFAVLSRQRVASSAWGRGVVLHGEKTPLWVLFRSGGRCWAEAPGGARLNEAELQTHYPEAYATFLHGVS